MIPLHHRIAYRSEICVINLNQKFYNILVSEAQFGSSQYFSQCREGDKPHRTNAFSCFRDVMVQFKLVKYKFSN